MGDKTIQDEVLSMDVDGVDEIVRARSAGSGNRHETRRTGYHAGYLLQCRISCQSVRRKNTSGGRSWNQEVLAAEEHVMVQRRGRFRNETGSHSAGSSDKIGIGSILEVSIICEIKFTETRVVRTFPRRLDQLVFAVLQSKSQKTSMLQSLGIEERSSDQR
jgi:hypothetical protein